MKELFCGFLNVSISGSLVIGVILLLRLLFRRGSKVMNCVFWLAAFVRLLLPFQITTPWSLLPTLPSVSGSDTQLITQPDTVMKGSIPEFVPQVSVPYAAEKVVVDYVAILSVLWVVGLAVMFLYMVLSYIQLNRKVSTAVKVEKNVYVAEGLQSAFLMGYFTPRIYITSDMEQRSAELVIAHELMHIKRGDNWLKLLGFACLAVHWFNPLVWLAYILLCRDVEDACDELVVKNLGAEEKKAYCTALLACGKPRKKMAVCPVAFGETSLRQRIKNVLSGHKPAVWISVIAVVAVIFVSFFLLTDPLKPVEVPQYCRELESLIGQPMEKVCEKLGITEEQLGEEVAWGIYQTPLKASYMDAEFELMLYFNVDNDLLSGFRYFVTYEGISEEAAAVGAAVARQMWKNYGKGYQWELKDDPKQFKDITGEALYAIHQNVYGRTGGYEISDQWVLSKKAPDNVETFLNQIEVSDYWQKNHAEHARLYGLAPEYFLRFYTLVDKENETTSIIMEYKTGFVPGRYSTVITSD